MSDEHHACLGGNATCEGSGESRDAEGLGTAVATVRAETPVLKGAVAVEPEADCADTP